ncbi:MAG: hypothetical protein ABSA66_15645 [Roseiarcus sp.]|jgi:hypothetical protein
MSDLLSQQIGEFRRQFGRSATIIGVTLSAEAVEAFDGLFASFQAQARLLEDSAPAPGTFEDLCRAASGEAKALAGMAKRLEATTARLRSAELLAFRPREGVK